jgi:mannose-6-phosphate isomerase class I
MPRKSNYDKAPFIRVSDDASVCVVGWEAIGKSLVAAIRGERVVVCVECYPGANEKEISAEIARGLNPAKVVRTTELLKSSVEIEAMVGPVLGDDPVFGRMNGIEIADLFDDSALAKGRAAIEATRNGLIVVVGTGASLVASHSDLFVYADMARWELQRRQRGGEIGNFGAENFDESPSLKYKRAFFIDWRAADRLKKEIWARLDFLLDTNDATRPKLIPGNALRDGLAKAASQPFRLVPFFDPGPWGGHWMEAVCDLPKDQPNYAWCFDCVPEENSLLLGFGKERVEIPSIDLVFFHPAELLGDAVYGRFGTEFPIRFDFLDTMGGGNLSLQVHPLTEYIQNVFGMNYTQDESYYLLDAGPEGTVYLGLKDTVDRDNMISELRESLNGEVPFDADRFVNRFPCRKHDHFLIPAGTIHCSGKESMVLEISATPYIFTFKLWDWERLGMNGLPRPIHIHHGLANIQWDRTTEWVKSQLVGQVQQIAVGEGWCEERTGLHEREFIETRRHWFTNAVLHNTNGGVNVLNLVQGEEATVESPDGKFAPFVVHYAETFVIPAAVGAYLIRPSGPSATDEHATVKAFVRTRA